MELTRTWSTATTRSAPNVSLKPGPSPALESSSSPRPPTIRSPAAPWLLLDRSKGSEFEHPLTRLTPEVCFPETEGFPDHYYSGPWPLDETHYLCAWHDRKLPPHRCMTGKEPENPGNAGGIYLYDAFGNLNLLYRDPRDHQPESDSTPSADGPPGHSPTWLTGVRPSEVASSCRTSTGEWRESSGGTINGNTVDGNAVRRIRVVGVLPKVQPQMNMPVLGGLSRGYRQGRSRHGAGSRGRLGLFRDSLRHPRLFPGPGRRRAFDSHDAVVDLCPAGADARLCRMPRIARFGPRSTVTCRRHSAANPIRSSPTRKAPGRCATTGSSSRCWTAIAPDATPRRRRPPNARSPTSPPAKSYDSLVNFAEKDLFNRAFERDESLPRRRHRPREPALRLTHRSGRPRRREAGCGQPLPPGRLDGHVCPPPGVLQCGARSRIGGVSPGVRIDHSSVAPHRSESTLSHADSRAEAAAVLRVCRNDSISRFHIQAARSEANCRSAAS